MADRQQLLQTLDELIAQGRAIHNQFRQTLNITSPDIVPWLMSSKSTVEAIFGTFSPVTLDFNSILFAPPTTTSFKTQNEHAAAVLTYFDSGMRFAIESLQGLRHSLAHLLPDRVSSVNPYVFISHGGPTRTHVNALRDMLYAIGLLPVIVSDLPNLGLSGNAKVLGWATACGSAVALATAEDEQVAAQKGIRPNVHHEIGVLQALPNIGGRIVYMKEHATKFPSNYSEFVWIEFQKEHVEKAFTPLLRELSAFGLIGPR